MLQSLLAAHPQIRSFPESHFYERLFSGRRLPAALGVASPKARLRWSAFLVEIGHPEMKATLPKHAVFVRQFSRAFVGLLDILTANEGRTVWLEKTPGHLRYADRIEQLVRDARFVHILRNGEDNVASLFETGQKYPDVWGPWYGTLDQCLQRWLADARKSRECASRNNHFLVRYEQLIADPGPVLAALCDFIGLPYDDKMLSGYTEAAEPLILKTEIWKASVGGPVRPADMRKFDDYLTEEQRRYIMARIPDDLRGCARAVPSSLPAP